MGSTRRAFTDEYKQQSVAFVIEDGRSIASVAKNIGVHEMTLGKWVRKARDERGELKDVRAENAELQMQVEFAKKVATWFAKGKQ